MEAIQKRLFELQDEKYKTFQQKLIPTVDPGCVIGVRTPALRALAKELLRDEQLAGCDGGTWDGGLVDAFLAELPHRYFEENQLHAFLISGMKDYDRVMTETKRFLPYVDNWATCDQMSPKVFRKHRLELLAEVRNWIASGETYTVRFGIGMLMQHFLEEDFAPEYPELVSGVRSEEYYVNMMIAWYFATALAKQYEAVLPYLEARRLEKWTHNKTIQKAVESYRITPEQKTYLKSLRWK